MHSCRVDLLYRNETHPNELSNQLQAPLFLYLVARQAAWKSCVLYDAKSDVLFLGWYGKEHYTLHAAAEFPRQKVCLYHHSHFSWVIMKLLKLGERKVAEAHRQALRPLRTRAWQRSDSHEGPPQNFAFTQLLRSTPTFPPQHPSLHLLLAFLHLSLPLIKTVNWLVHTC